MDSADDRGGGGGPPGTAGPDGTRGHTEDAAPNDGRREPPDGPRTAEEALHALKGDSADRIDVARAAEILADAMRRRGPSGGPFTLFTGDVKVERDLTIGSTRVDRARAPAGRSRPIARGHVVDYTAHYLDPTGFADAERLLERQHLVLLCGADGTGREAAALVLLSRLLGSPAALFDIAPDCLRDDAGWTPERSAGYLATLADGGRRGFGPDQMDDGWLTRTGAKLAEAGSFLVVVTGPVRGSLSEATRRRDFVVEDLVPADPHAIVAGRVRAADLPQDPAEIERRLAAAEVADLLAERPTPRFAVRVALAVITALAADADLAEALSPLRDAREQVREWFARHDEPEQIAFAVAAAVLEGSSYLTLSDAAVQLMQAVTRSGGAPARTRFRPRLEDDQRWLRIGPASRRGAGMPMAPEAVTFRGVRTGPEVLRHAWFELDGWRGPLLSWLRVLAAHADIEVRARAAAAAGQLAAGDFQHGLHRYLLPWARNDAATVRQSAAFALGVVGADPQLSDLVWTLLRQWAEEVRHDAESRLPATATMALGGPLAVAEPARALRILRVILADGGWDLVLPASLSALQLIDEGRAAEVVHALLDWTEPADGELEVRGLLVFAFAVRQRGVGADGDGPPGPVWPTLLTQVDRFRDELPELWGRALDSPAVRDLALDALREWLHLVDDDWTAYGVVLDLLAGVADRGERDAARLLYHLDRCAETEYERSAAARAMHTALVEAGDDEVEARW